MKLYTQPEIEIRKYSVIDVLTTSNPEHNEGNDLNTDDNYDYFG
ncbi:MAG: hypothetical protein PUE73_02635 [Eubacteriales bacterium]|nr:hypothetical protein [Eubacteriales bacterium]